LRPAFAGAALAVLLTACAAPQSRNLLREQPAHIPTRVELTRTPFYPQEQYQCGPAALAMALGAAGVDIEPERIVPQVYLPERQGSLQMELLASARRNQTLAYELSPLLDDLLAEVAAGNPAIVLQNLGLSWAPRWHYAVVVGYDLTAGEILLRSGREQRQIMRMHTFEHTWARGGHWAMLTLPPGRLPATVKEARYAQAAVAFEANGDSEAAHAAYAAAVARWPNNFTARMGLGNTAYALNDLDAAADAFRQAAVDHPDAAAAHNNLAHVLHQQGHFAAALISARQAVALEGPLADAARGTLAEIEASIAANRAD
jgi:tetratricopeptide (TPR) repeat protein